MSERYCPECKQNVDVADAEDYIFTPCFNCGYAFGVVVDKVELEALVVALEKAAHTLAGVSASAPIYGDPRHPISRGCSVSVDAAAKFRKKYLAKCKKSRA